MTDHEPDPMTLDVRPGVGEGDTLGDIDGGRGDQGRVDGRWHDRRQPHQTRASGDRTTNQKRGDERGRSQQGHIPAAAWHDAGSPRNTWRHAAPSRSDGDDASGRRGRAECLETTFDIVPDIGHGHVVEGREAIAEIIHWRHPGAVEDDFDLG